MNKKVIYTCITGGYEQLREPSFVNDDFDYICFADNESIKSNVWQIKEIPSEFNEYSNVKKTKDG